MVKSGKKVALCHRIAVVPYKQQLKINAILFPVNQWHQIKVSMAVCQGTNTAPHVINIINSLHFSSLIPLGSLKRF